MSRPTARSSRSPLVRTTRSSWLWIMTKHSLSTTSSLLLVSNLASILQEKQAWRLMRSVPALLSMPNWKPAQTSSLLVTWYPSMMYSSAVVASNTTTSKSKSYVPVEVVLHTHIQLAAIIIQRCIERSSCWREHGWRRQTIQASVHVLVSTVEHWESRKQ